MSEAPSRPGPVALIGQTALVQLATSPGSAVLYAKCEQYNPGGSVKDRVALALLEAAERSGRLSPGQPVVAEAVGNLGLALALVCKAQKRKLRLEVPTGTSPGRMALLRAFGAEVVTPASAATALPDALRLDTQQPAALEAHAGTAREILEQLGRVPDVLVAAAGSGATVTGMGQVLRHAGPARIVAVGERLGPDTPPDWAGIQGVSTDTAAALLARGQCDEARAVSAREAYDSRRVLARRSGLLVGLSSGAAVHAALEIASKRRPEQVVVVLLPDTGERYFALDAAFSDSSDAAQASRGTAVS